MISRNWTGIAKKERAREYILHLQNDTFKKLEKIKGFLNSRILYRDMEEGTAFLIITEWESIEAIKKFAGEDYNLAVVPQLVKEMMIRYEHKVNHYQIIS